MKETKNEGKFGDASFSAKAHLCLQACSLVNTLSRLSQAWKSFNIRQKLGMFVLHSIWALTKLKYFMSYREIL